LGKNDEQDKTWIESLNPSDVEQLKAFIVAEATTIMDDYCTNAYKRKALRLSRKPGIYLFFVVQLMFSDSLLPFRPHTKYCK